MKFRSTISRAFLVPIRTLQCTVLKCNCQGLPIHLSSTASKRLKRAAASLESQPVGKGESGKVPGGGGRQRNERVQERSHLRGPGHPPRATHPFPSPLPCCSPLKRLASPAATAAPRTRPERSSSSQPATRGIRRPSETRTEAAEPGLHLPA